MRAQDSNLARKESAKPVKPRSDRGPQDGSIREGPARIAFRSKGETLMVRARLVLTLALVSAPFLVVGREIRADDDPAAKASDVDAAIGTWGGALGTKSDAFVIDAFALRVERTPGGYRATTRVDATQPMEGGAPRKFLV